MSTDTDKTITDNAVISEEILGKIENAAREGARQGSKESKGGRGGIGLFEIFKSCNQRINRDMNNIAYR